MKINEIAKKTLTKLSEEGKSLTPENYGETFCKVAKSAGVLLDECSIAKKYVEKLDAPLQKELQGYTITTASSLLSFLVSRMNRTSGAEASKNLQVMSVLLKRVFQAISVLHNQKAAELANRSINILENFSKPENLEELKDEWVDFLTTYDDSFFDKINKKIPINKQNVARTIEALVPYLVVEEGDTDENLVYKELAQVIISSMVPSIAPSMNDELAAVSSQIRQDPALLNTPAMLDDLRYMIKKRIKLDKDALKETVVTFDEIMDKISMQLISLIEESNSSNQNITKIKRELSGINIKDEKNFEVAHSKLIKVAENLENETKKLNLSLTAKEDEIKNLSGRVHELEEALQLANKESRSDFLTKLNNKRALDENLQYVDEEYNRYKKDFSVIFIDIDHFKNINDTYGHDAGDSVLRAFASILKRTARKVDVVGRWGGEEFLVILPSTNKSGATNFAEKFRERLSSAKFMYKNQRMEITASFGVASRKESANLADLIKEADKRLYTAKETGRDRVVFK